MEMTETKGGQEMRELKKVILMSMVGRGDKILYLLKKLKWNWFVTEEDMLAVLKEYLHRNQRYFIFFRDALLHKIQEGIYYYKKDCFTLQRKDCFFEDVLPYIYKIPRRKLLIFSNNLLKIYDLTSFLNYYLLIVDKKWIPITVEELNFLKEISQ